ncbi:MAG: translation elongation factor Ts [Clostridiales bacterium]|jgi:elongation factor Ts|nr:translation elongation factor Ts [Clostridiales bacterium]
MAFTANDVRDLRVRTGAGMMDCKNALVETNGDVEKAIEYLREKGIAKAAKRSGRIASQGIVDSYIHMGGKIGVLLEINCETDFVAKGDMFKDLSHDLTLQIAAAKALYITREDVPPEEIEHEKNIIKAQITNDETMANKPEHVKERFVEGRMEKFFKDICLLEQPFVKDPSKTVNDVVLEAISKIGEKISVRRFVRYEMGEGLEKKSCNLADEVDAEIAKMSK